ncbi:hypothetical protein RJT34_03195 [Clitoria ternatea]|uniref:Uncharacterized protein n=1 Tax=Clitoria ternatea TaxID=43366 RepID=A0AAN9KLS2_CLITE
MRCIFCIGHASQSCMNFWMEVVFFGCVDKEEGKGGWWLTHCYLVIGVFQFILSLYFLWVSSVILFPSFMYSYKKEALNDKLFPLQNEGICSLKK